MPQPADETPLPIQSAPADLDALHPSIATAERELEAAYNVIRDQVSDQYSSVMSDLDQSAADRDQAVAEIAGTLAGELDDIRVKHNDAVKRMDAKIRKDLKGVEDQLLEQGATLPLYHYERLQALADQTGQMVAASVMPAVMRALGLETPDLARDGEAPGDTTTISQTGPGGTPPIPLPPPPVPPGQAPPIPMPGPAPGSPAVPPVTVGSTSPPLNPPLPPGPPLPGQLVPPAPVSPPGVPPVIIGPPIATIPPPPVIIPPVPPGTVVGITPPGTVVITPAPPAPPGSCPVPPTTVTCGTSPPTSPAPGGTSGGHDPDEPLPGGNDPGDVHGPNITVPETLVAQWGYLSTCKSAESICDGLASAVDKIDDVNVKSSGAGLFTGLMDNVTSFMDKINPTPYLTDLRLGWDTVKSAVQFSTQSVFPSYLPNVKAAMPLCAHIALMETAGRVTGAPTDYLATWARYQLQFCNPLFIPSQSELNGMYYRNYITKEDWECHTKANGNIAVLAERSMLSGAFQPDQNTVVTLYMRGVIKSEKEYMDRQRNNGILDESYARELLILADNIPTPGDLVQFMVRDSGDEAVVKQYDYDKDFEKKTTKQIRDWMKANGIGEQYMRYIWRAHWKIPSDTQLYICLHRLRPDREEVKEWDRTYGPGGQQANAQFPPPRPPVVTIQDVKNALEVNDLAPGFVDAMLAISYHPLTNSDARRAYMLGQFTESQLTESMLNNGYSPSDTKLLVEFFKAEKDKTLSIQSGVLSIRKIVKFYKDGAINATEFDQELWSLIPDEHTRQQLFDRTNLEQEAEIRQSCIKYIHKKYMFGELNHAQAELELLQIGVYADQVTRILQKWNCEKDNRLREPRVAMLCDWYTKGYLSNQEYIRRLENLGYSENDSYRIAASCWVAEMQRRWKQQIAEQEKLIKEWQRQQREDKADYKDAIKEAKDRIKEIQKQQKDQVKALKEQQSAPPGQTEGAPIPPGR